jgi:chromosomal replication initiation ATPase DnaA
MLAMRMGMYLCHTSLSLPLQSIGRMYRRDPRSVAHACARIEDKRDERMFDWLLSTLEEVIRVQLLCLGAGERGAPLRSR